jgi:hypothetical protein
LAQPAILSRSPQFFFQNDGLSVLSSIGEREKSRVGCFVVTVFGKTFPGETVYCRYATASSFATKVRGKVLACFHTVAAKHHSSMQN